MPVGIIGAMKKFISARERNMRNGLIAQGFEWGDWLALDNEAIIGNGVFGRTDPYYIANVLHAHSLRIVADAAKLLGDEEERVYRDKYETLMPDGTPNPDGMNSYNHYAYGSVMEFVYRRIAGIETVGAGFNNIRVAPNPCNGLASLKAEYESAHGKIVSGYARKNGKTIFTIEIPDGVSAEIVLPNEKPIKVAGGKFEYERK